MPIADTLRQVSGLPLGESMPIVIDALRGQSLVLPLASEPLPDGTLAMLVGQDNEGRNWIYAFSSDQELTDSGTTAAASRHVPFDQLLSMANASGNGGIIIDFHKSPGSYPIPGEFFADIVAYLAQ